ncbi:annexin A1-like [Salmo salar]|uniref:Annexin A1-like n=1 Tax=Salmo salar TaxID=8030 RepID=A0ABM3DMZ5_SALSA|nr:annexin A1-like [Salmo salar]
MLLLNIILSHSPSLSAFERYSKYSKVDVAKAIDLELNGDFENCLTAVVKCAGCKPAFFAEKLNLALKANIVTCYVPDERLPWVLIIRGKGTRTNILTRVMVSRSEVDLARIKQENKKTNAKYYGS